MKIAIDMTPISNAHEYRGIGVYAKHLVEALQRYEKGIRIVFLPEDKKCPISSM